MFGGSNETAGMQGHCRAAVTRVTYTILQRATEGKLALHKKPMKLEQAKN
jgi:hypothetical protein